MQPGSTSILDGYDYEFGSSGARLQPHKESPQGTGGVPEPRGAYPGVGLGRADSTAHPAAASTWDDVNQVRNCGHITPQSSPPITTCHSLSAVPWLVMGSRIRGP